MADATPKSVPELTVRAVLLGLVLSAVMGAANVYLGLKAGMTVSASIPAAVIAMLILRGVFRTGSVLEANQVQTAASAGESLAAGIIFTMPALVLIGAWTEFDMLMTTLIAFSGGLLGILFMIPMRRVFVTSNRKELKFPEGVACASVLNAGETSKSDAWMVVVGTLLGGGLKIFASFFSIMKGSLEGAIRPIEQVFYLFGTRLDGRVLFFGSDISPALVAVGFIVRLNVALLMFLGGAIGWLIAIPILGTAGHHDAVEDAWALWSGQVRYIGVGAMVVGGITSIIKVRDGLFAAVKQISDRVRNIASVDDDGQRDLPAPVIIGLMVTAVVLVGGVYFKLTHNVAITAATTVIMIVMSFFFTAVASYIVGLVGNSNSPVSGMTITAVLFTGGLLTVFGFTGMEGMTATLGVAAIVCCAACTSGDVCNDLKTGQIVGASPRRQQIMQVLGVAVASLVMAPVLQLLHDNTPGGIGGRELAAPQASLFKSLAEGFFGEGQIPWNMVVIGAVIGVVISLADTWLERRDAKFRLYLMPVAVGIYLPFALSVPIVVGGLVAWLAQRKVPEAQQEAKLHRGILLSSGLIAGESLMGVGLALLASLGISRLNPGLSDSALTLITVVISVIFVALFALLSYPKSKGVR